MGFTPLHQILPTTLQKNGMRPAVEAAVVCRMYNLVSMGVLHPKAPVNAIAKSFKNGTLTIGVISSAWAEFMSKNGEKLRAALNEKLNSPLIKKIKIRVVEKLETVD